MPTMAKLKAEFGHPSVRFAVFLAGVVSVAVGFAKVNRVYSADASPSLEGTLGLVFFIAGLLVSFHCLKRDIVREVVDELRRDQGQDKEDIRSQSRHSG